MTLLPAGVARMLVSSVCVWLIAGRADQGKCEKKVQYFFHVSDICVPKLKLMSGIRSQ
jgi:hypothetical protein